jgi:hypothetical protein
LILKSEYLILNGQMAEWLKATDCKSVHVSVRRFEPYSAHKSNGQFAIGKLGLLYKFFKLTIAYCKLPVYQQAEVAHLVER